MCVQDGVLLQPPLWDVPEEPQRQPAVHDLVRVVLEQLPAPPAATSAVHGRWGVLAAAHVLPPSARVPPVQPGLQCAREFLDAPTNVPAPLRTESRRRWRLEPPRTARFRRNSGPAVRRQWKSKLRIVRVRGSPGRRHAQYTVAADYGFGQ